MANDTDSVRAAIVTAIEGIATSKLGFDTEHPNVKNILLDEEIGANVTKYLSARVGGKRGIVRAWGVQTLGREFPASNNEIKLERAVRVLIEGYYGVYGESPINLARTHASKVKEAIVGIDFDLSNTVSTYLEIGEVDYEKLLIEDVDREIYKVFFEVSAFTRGALDW